MAELDFVQIELVVLAWLSNDKNMRQVYIDKADLHERTALGMHEVPDGVKVTSDQRDDGKRMNFGQVYGQTEQKCAELWKKPLELVQKFFQGFNATYPGIKKFMEEVEAKIIAGKPIVTPWGRLRTGKLTGNWREDAHTLLELKNFLIQSTAADITTFFLPYVFELLDKHNLLWLCHPNNIVYDAIWFDLACDEETYQYVANLPPGVDVDLPVKHPIRKVMTRIKRLMENNEMLPIGMDLPLAVDGKIGISMSKADMRKLVLAA